MRFSRHRRIILAGLAGVVISFLAFSTQAATFHVSPQGSDTPPYNTYATAAQRIIDAIRLATEFGDTILVHAGTYDVDSTLYIARGVTWLGVGRDSVLVNWVDKTYVGSILARLLGQNEVAGIDFRYPFGTANTDAYALWAHTYPESDTVDIHDCRFHLFKPVIGGNSVGIIHENELYHGAADGVDASSPCALIFNNLFAGWRDGYGVRVNGAGTVLVEHNVFDNTRLLGGGISEGRPEATVYVTGASQVTIRNNVIRQSRRQFIWFYANGIIENNTFIDTGDPYATSSQDDAWIYQRYYQTLRIRNNVFCKSARLRFGLSCDDCDSTGWITLSYNAFWPPMDSFFVLHPGDPPERVKVFDSMNVNAYPMLTPDTLFQLQAHSPLIDGGDPTVLDADGSRSDAGWTGGPSGYLYIYEDFPPLPPESLWVAGDGESVTITWSLRHEADLEEYRLYRDTYSGFWTPGLSPQRVLGPADTAVVETLLATGETHYYVVTAVDTSGLESEASVERGYNYTSVFDDDADPLPRSPSIMRVYPNPSNAAVTIEVSIPESVARRTPIAVVIYNLLGQEHAIAFQGTLEPGNHQLTWDGHAADGRPSASGLYFARLRIGQNAVGQPRKIVLLK